MELLNSNFIIAVCVSILYFIVKNIVEKEKGKNKRILKDSILVGVISYAVLIMRNNFVSFENTKTHVFTNDPNF